MEKRLEQMRGIEETREVRRGHVEMRRKMDRRSREKFTVHEDDEERTDRKEDDVHFMCYFVLMGHISALIQFLIVNEL